MNNGQSRICSVEDKVEANARAIMWLFLKEEGLL